MKRTRIRLVPPTALRPHEETDCRRVGTVIDSILERQAWTQPICVENESLSIMDGHHRQLAAIQLGLALVPVAAFSYDEVRLGSWRDDLAVEGSEVISRALSGSLYPPKSTRHLFPPFDISPVPLSSLIVAAAS